MRIESFHGISMFNPYGPASGATETASAMLKLVSEMIPDAVP